MSDCVNNTVTCTTTECPVTENPITEELTFEDQIEKLLVKCSESELTHLLQAIRMNKNTESSLNWCKTT